MRRPSVLLLVLFVTGLTWQARPTARHAAQAPAPITIPFELVGRHIIVKVSVNKSRPLSFILDTGANQAIVRTDTAKALGLKLEGTVTGGGAGAATQTGSMVRNATWALVGLPGFKQPLSLALPFPELPRALGQDIDGIIGGEFIKEFVVEVDYQARTITLHKPETFQYAGTGESLPIDFIFVTHPVITATVTPVGGAPLERRFHLDLGSGGALILHSPFVREQNLLSSGMETVRLIGAAGAGGRTKGRVGRVASLRIGSFTLASPMTMFSQDRAGAFANSELAGNIGAQIAARFRLTLDYSRKRIFLEPSATFGDPFDRAISGLALRADGPDYRSFRVLEVLEESPATEAGFLEGDVIASVNGAPASDFTLSQLHELFEKPATYDVTIRRGDRTLAVKLTPRRMV